MDTKSIALRILATGYVCDHCLGRQFAQLLSGYSNVERGRIVRTALAMELETSESEVNIDESNFSGFRFRKRKAPVGIAKQPECWVCKNIFAKTGILVKRAIEETSDIEFETFQFGTTLMDELLSNEEKLWEAAGTDFCEPIKTEINREAGKLFSEKTKKRVDLKNPEVAIHLDLKKNIIEPVISPIFLFGRYKKFAKIPQTRHICQNCRGLGCDKCGFKGKIYETSVQDLVGASVLKATGGVDTLFHGAGREDIDVLCLDWRDFVLEVVEPGKRKISPKKIEAEINRKNKGKIEISSLSMTSREKVIEVKSAKEKKTYRVLAGLKEPVKKADLKKLDALVAVINQQTPTRVARRRADIIRKRHVYSVSYKLVDKNHIELTVQTEAGLYIKELVSGDSGRTRPSVSALLGNEAVVEKLEVVGFEKDAAAKEYKNAEAN